MGQRPGEIGLISVCMSSTNDSEAEALWSQLGDFDYYREPSERKLKGFRHQHSQSYALAGLSKRLFLITK